MEPGIREGFIKYHYSHYYKQDSGWREWPMSPSFPSSQKETIFTCWKHNKNCPGYRKRAAEMTKQRSSFYRFCNSVNIRNCPPYAKIKVTSTSLVSLPPPLKKLAYEKCSTKFSHLSDEHQESSFNFSCSLHSSSRWKAKFCPAHPVCTRVWLLLRVLPRPVSFPPTQASFSGVEAGSRASEYEWRMLGLWED